MQLYPQETPHAASRVEGKAKVITPPESRASFGALEAPVKWCFFRYPYANHGAGIFSNMTG